MYIITFTRPALQFEKSNITHLAVADHDHHVVDIGVDLVASVEDTTLIGVPGGSIDVDRERTNGGNSVHHAQVIVVRELDVAVNAGHGEGLQGRGDGAGVVGACKKECIIGMVGVRWVGKNIIRTIRTLGCW